MPDILQKDKTEDDRPMSTSVNSNNDVQKYNFSNTFDVSSALSGIFLWIIFSYLSTLLNCDLQRFLVNNPIWIHCFGITAFFFLFTVLDPNNKSHVGIIWIKTFIVYTLFILMTKSKWYFVIPVIVLLLVDQTLKKDVAIKHANAESGLQERERFQKWFSSFIIYVIIGIIIVGSIHYAYLQKLEYKSKFSLAKFIFGVNHNCKAKTPVYK
jgi:hypothetical protein